MDGEKVSCVVIFFYFRSINVLKKLQKPLFSSLGTRPRGNLLKLIVCSVAHMANCQYFDQCAKRVSKRMTV